MTITRSNGTTYHIDRTAVRLGPSAATQWRWTLWIIQGVAPQCLGTFESKGAAITAANTHAA